MSDETDAKVIFEQRPTQETFQALIEQLESQKKCFRPGAASNEIKVGTHD